MNIDEIRKLVEIVKENELMEFELDEENLSIRIKRRGEFQHVSVAPQIPVQTPNAQPDFSGSVMNVNKDDGVSSVDEEVITSPMVGTFYRSPSPDSPAFVQKGQKVDADTVVCIVEAMKVMNEILSEKKGIITEVLVEDGDAVEFGQPLFKISN